MKNSKIQWTDHTFSPWEGCTKCSPGCENCYAETRNHRFKNDNWGKGKPRLERSEGYWREPLKWNKAGLLCPQCGQSTRFYEWNDCECHQFGLEGNTRRPRVFCSALSDWLDDEVPIEWLARLLKLVNDTPNLDWLLLSKRPQNFCRRISDVLDAIDAEKNAEVYECLLAWRGGEAPSNVWIGTSVEDQKRADERIPALFNIPARVRFLSVEPMLETVDLRLQSFEHEMDCDSDLCALAGGEHDCVGHVEYEERLHWVIFGGESGPGARPCNVDWIADGVQQCRDVGVPAFVKQLGSNPITDNANLHDFPDDVELYGSGEGFAACSIKLKHPKGGDPSEWPADLNIQDFPVLKAEVPR